MTRHPRAMAGPVLLVLLLILPLSSFSSVDSAGEDLIIDAPWRTVRDYLPVLFFTPDFEENADRKIISFSLHNYNPDSKQSTLIFEDSRNLDLGLEEPLGDDFPCAVTFLDPDGRVRSPINKGEQIRSFWHYIARVPVACIGMGSQRGKPGVHYLWGTIIRGDVTFNTRLADLVGIKSLADLVEAVPGRIKFDTKVLRVVVTTDGFAKFSPVDHQYDVHVHTIAEQTKWHGVTNPDAARKAFGGPVAMLFESAYALGLVDVQLDNANWSAYKNKIITTDHNVFFSGPPYDAGTHPGHDGPTSKTDGKGGEFQWYRTHLGVLGGEEITVQGANGVPHDKLDTDHLALGSHLLAYGAPHFEGPWHGGKIDLNPIKEGADNKISVGHAIARMGSSDGFGYASHPENSSIGWSQDYYERAIGLGSFNRSGGDSPILQRNGTEFVFKGLQIWNEHNDMKSRDSGDIEVSESHHFNPFTVADTGQRFEKAPSGKDWRRGHDKTYEAYKRLVSRGLYYSFSERREHVFIRKLYLSAGTDAHGDFNYSMSIPSTVLTGTAEAINPYSKSLSAGTNAFGRLRTYTLTSQRYIRAGNEIPAYSNCPEYPFCGGSHSAPSYYPLEDYKEGNTVVTDGPVGRFSADGNCRFNSDIHKLIWHDDLCRWENHDGLIGGRGVFDGGNTLLAPVGNEGVYVYAQWIGKNDYLPDHLAHNGPMALRYVRIKARRPNGTDSGPSINAGPPRSLHIDALNDVLGSPVVIDFPGKTALLLEGQLGHRPDETKFITNPMWIAPYKITIDGPTGCPINPGALTVTVEFGLSMDTTLPAAPTRPDAAQVGDVLKAEPALLVLSRTLNDTSTKGLRNGPRGPLDSAPVVDKMAPEVRSPYEGLRVSVKPLNSIGNSGERSFLVSHNNAHWEPVIYGEFGSKRIQDAKYVTSNRKAIPCGGDWDTELHRPGRGLSAYAVIVDQIHDMNQNYMNPIGTTFMVQDNSGPGLFDPRDHFDPSPRKVRPTEVQLDCSASDAKLCDRHGADCEVLGSGNDPKAGLCRWNSASSAEQCKRTAGIWTAVNSRFARNHPAAVPLGKTGACITEARNLLRRIQ